MRHESCCRQSRSWRRCSRWSRRGRARWSRRQWRSVRSRLRVDRDHDVVERDGDPAVGVEVGVNGLAHARRDLVVREGGVRYRHAQVREYLVRRGAPVQLEYVVRQRRRGWRRRRRAGVRAEDEGCPRPHSFLLKQDYFFYSGGRRTVLQIARRGYVPSPPRNTKGDASPSPCGRGGGAHHVAPKPSDYFGTQCRSPSTVQVDEGHDVWLSSQKRAAQRVASRALRWFMTTNSELASDARMR